MAQEFKLIGHSNICVNLCSKENINLITIEYDAAANIIYCNHYRYFHKLGETCWKVLRDVEHALTNPKDNSKELAGSDVALVALTIPLQSSLWSQKNSGVFLGGLHMIVPLFGKRI